MVYAQAGLDRVFTRPTRIVVAESGPEHVKVTPLGRAEVERLIDRKMRPSRRSIDELALEMDYALGKRMMRQGTAR